MVKIILAVLQISAGCKPNPEVYVSLALRRQVGVSTLWGVFTIMSTRFVSRTREQLDQNFWLAKREGVKRFLCKRAQESTPSRSSYAALAPHQHNVLGVGVGRKYTAAKGTADYAVRVYVRSKLPLSKLGKHAIPKMIAGIPTDVVETGRFRAADSLSSTRRSVRPVCAGASVGFADNGKLVAGTITAIVERGGNRFILSNNHVLAFENRMALGTDIIQPGALDDGQTPRDRIATLTEFVPLTAEGNMVDAAIAALDNAIATKSRFAYRIRLSSVAPLSAKPQMSVAKLGRGTGYTEGQIDDLGIDVQVDFDTGEFSFVDQLLIKGVPTPFADVGDSGSMVVSSGAISQPVAMVFATSPQFALATPIGRVLTILNVEIVE